MEAKGLRQGYGYLGPLFIVLGFLAAWLLLRKSSPISHVFFLGFFSIVIAAMMDLPVSWLSRRLPRWAATAAVLAAGLLLLAGTLWLAVPAVKDQGGQVMEQAAVGLERLRDWWARMSSAPLMQSMGGDSGDMEQKLKAELGSLAVKAVPLAFGTASIVAEAFAVLVIATFLVVKPGAYVAGILRLFPKEKERRVGEVFASMGQALRGWTFGTLISMAIIGSITGLGLFLLGVKGWLALAVLAFFGEFIPLAGPFLSAVPALVVALADSPQTALYVALLYLGTQQLEGNIVQPLVMKEAVHIRPPVLILWQMLFALGFGFMGLLVATPLLAVAQAALARGYIKGVLNR